MLRHYAIVLVLCAVALLCLGATLFQEKFTGGTTDNEWKALGEIATPVDAQYNDNIQVVPVSSVPGAVAPPGNTTGYVGAIEDVDNNYMGIAGAYATATAGLTDIIYEAWVYCYDADVNGSSPRGGIVGRIGGTAQYARYFAYLSADTIRIQTYTGAWYTSDYTGRTETAGWHKMKMKFEGDTLTIWFDDMVTPVASETLSELADPITSGHIGVQVLHYLASDPVAIYYDQILVTDLAGPTTPTPTPSPTQEGAAVSTSWTIYE